VWRLLQFSYERAHAVLAVVLLLTGLLGFAALNVRVDVSTEGLMPRRSERQREYERIRSTFGSDKTAIVFIEDRHLFTFERLQKLRALNNALAVLPGVQRIESLFTVSHIKGGGGWLETGALLDAIPEDAAQLQEIKNEALRNPLLAGSLLSADGNATLITLFLDEGESESTAPGAGESESEASNLNFDRDIFHKIENAIYDFEGEFDELFQTGSPTLQVQMADHIIADQRFLLPLAGFLMLLLIGITQQNLHAAIIPLCNAGISTVWTLGLMALLGIPINMLNYIVPALILVVGATEDVHLISEIEEARRQGKNKDEAVLAAGQTIGLTLLFTALTTTLGFAATGLSRIPILQQFAISAAIGMTCRSLMTFFFTPAYVRYFVKTGTTEAESPKKELLLNRFSNNLAAKIMDGLVGRPAQVILVFGGLSIAGIFYGSQLVLNNDVMSFLGEDTSVVKNINKVAERLAGSKVVYLTIQGNPGDFKKADALQRLKEIDEQVSSLGGIDTATSIADYLCLINREMRGGGQEHFTIPADDALISQYLLFFHPGDLAPYVSFDYSQANIVLRNNLNNSTQFNQLMNRIRGILDNGQFGPLTYSLTGKAVLVSSAVDKIAVGQAASLGALSVMLFMIVAVMFVSLRCGLLVLAANLFHVAVLFGLMGWASIPLNVGTCMVAAITVGIGIDDTLHLMIRYNRELKQLKNENKAIRRTLQAELPPVLVTSLGLATGFFILSFSSFVPVQQFGQLSALVILLAALADLVLTPVLLAMIRLITLWELLGLKLRTELMQKSRLFQGLTHWQVKKLILISRLVEYKAGHMVLREGKTGDSMYVVIEGELEVSKKLHDQRTTLSRLTAGDVFGEIALIINSARTADVEAVTDTKVLAIDWESLEKIQRFSPYLASRLYLNIARILGERLGKTTTRLDHI